MSQELNLFGKRGALVVCFGASRIFFFICIVVFFIIFIIINIIFIFYYYSKSAQTVNKRSNWKIYLKTGKQLVYSASNKNKGKECFDYYVSIFL